MEVETARAHGQPHSVVTGRVVRPGEPLWLPVDTALALALQRLEAARCPGCGGDQRDTTDPGNEFAYTAEAVRCFQCAARDRAAETHTDAGGTSHGLMFATRRGGEDARH